MGIGPASRRQVVSKLPLGNRAVRDIRAWSMSTAYIIRNFSVRTEKYYNSEFNFPEIGTLIFKCDMRYISTRLLLVLLYSIYHMLRPPKLLSLFFVSLVSTEAIYSV